VPAIPRTPDRVPLAAAPIEQALLGAGPEYRVASSLARATEHAHEEVSGARRCGLGLQAVAAQRRHAAACAEPQRAGFFAAGLKMQADHSIVRQRGIRARVFAHASLRPLQQALLRRDP